MGRQMRRANKIPRMPMKEIISTITYQIFFILSTNTNNDSQTTHRNLQSEQKTASVVIEKVVMNLQGEYLNVACKQLALETKERWSYVERYTVWSK